jgi:hypothetical protein
MNIYFQNPSKPSSFIQWNGSTLFHHGSFKDDEFVPDEIFTLVDTQGKGYSFDFVQKYVKEIFFFNQTT